MDEDVELSFEVGQKEDGKLWTLSVSCPQKITELEFAAAIQSLAHDILHGEVSFDSAEDVTESDSH